MYLARGPLFLARGPAARGPARPGPARKRIKLARPAAGQKNPARAHL